MKAKQLDLRIGHNIVDMPEFNIVVFGFLLSFPWEMLQVPFYAGMRPRSTGRPSNCALARP